MDMSPEKQEDRDQAAAQEESGTATRPLREHSYYPVLYMFAVTFFFSAIVIGIAKATQARVTANKKVMFEKALLEATLPGHFGDGIRVNEAHELFLKHAKLPKESSGGAYRILAEGKLVAYGLPFEGQGYWDVVKGVIGLSVDGSEVIGVCFYQQKETPGLGGEIVKPAFRGQFRGLRLGPGEKPLAIVPGGTATREWEVEAVTGATQTCSRVERIINDALRQWRRRKNGERESLEEPEA